MAMEGWIPDQRKDEGRAGFRGITLIELLLVITILGIVAMLAYPAYTDVVRKGRRADAVMSLFSIQLAQERHRAAHHRYAERLTELGWGSDETESYQGHYRLSLEAVDDAGIAFRAHAVPAPASDQARDVCVLFALNQNGPDLAGSSHPVCWNHLR